VAQLVEHHLAKVRVAGSNPVVRSEVPDAVPVSRRSARLFGTRAGSVGVRYGGMAEWLRQGPAKPCTRVRFPLPPRGRLAQRESASLTRKRPQVQILYRPPGQGHNSLELARSVRPRREHSVRAEVRSGPWQHAVARVSRPAAGPESPACRGSPARTPWRRARPCGRPQPTFVRLADEGRLTGRLLDVACGTGENALLAASHGADVTGIDVAPTAIARARAKASERGLTARFEVPDALDLGCLSLTVDTVIDSGMFHVFGDDDRARYVASLAAVLRPAGACYLMCFSDRQPGTWGPASRPRGRVARGVQRRLGRRVDYRRHLRDQPDGRHDAGPGLASHDQA
jgi:SAM-dependent methyltransferase